MASLYGRFFEPARFAAPYERPEEHLRDAVRACEMLLCAYVACQREWRGEAAVRALRLLAPPERLAGLFPDRPTPESLRNDVLREYDKAHFHIQARVQASVEKGAFLALQYMREVWQMQELEMFFLLLSVMPQYDTRFGQVFAFLQNANRVCPPDADLAMRLFHFTERTEQIYGYCAQRRALEEKARFAFLNRTGGIDARACDFILQNGETQLKSEAAAVFLPGTLDSLPVKEDTAARIAQAVAGDDPEADTLYVCLKGRKGVGRTTLIRRAAERMGIPVTVFDCTASTGLRREEFFEALETACRECILVQGALAVTALDALAEEPDTVRRVLNTAGRYSGAVFVTVEEQTVTVPFSGGRRWLEVTVPLPGRAERTELWRQALSRLPMETPADPYELANKFAITPAQIAGAVQAAQGMVQMGRSADKQTLTQAVYHQISHKLNEHATRIHAHHTWDQLVLADEELKMLRRACDQVRYKHIVYDQWGFDRRLAYGKGVSMLFAGPPGTGKTMAAQVAASDLGIELYKVDLSRVVSKYIGETEKNLDKVFGEAKKLNGILLFDETDAILGKRTEVKDSHDKNANLETAYLLQKMEEYDGITVMTTNYLENIDSAFFRRISYVIHFAFPDAGARRQIWQGIFPKETPLEDVDFDYLSRQFELSGGSIKNIAVAAAFMAASEQSAVSMRQILRAVQYETKKQGKIMRRDDYGEYGFLLDEERGTERYG